MNYSACHCQSWGSECDWPPPLQLLPNQNATPARAISLVYTYFSDSLLLCRSELFTRAGEKTAHFPAWPMGRMDERRTHRSINSMIAISIISPSGSCVRFLNAVPHRSGNSKHLLCCAASELPFSKPVHLKAMKTVNGKCPRVPPTVTKADIPHRTIIMIRNSLGFELAQ